MAGNGGDGGDAAGELGREEEGHRRAVGKSGDKNAIGIGIALALDIIQDGAEECDIVWPGVGNHFGTIVVPEIAIDEETGGAGGIGRQALGKDGEEMLGVGFGDPIEICGGGGGTAAGAVKHHDDRHGHRRVGRGDMKKIGADDPTGVQGEMMIARGQELGAGEIATEEVERQNDSRPETHRFFREVVYRLRERLHTSSRLGE